MKLVLAVLVAAFPCVSCAGFIQTMTFSGVTPLERSQYVEDGITATGVISSFQTPGTVHIDRDGTGLDQPMFFTTGSLFTPLSVMVDPHGSAYCASCEAGSFITNGENDPIPYIWFSGYRGGVLFSTAGLYLPPSEVFSPFSLSFLGEVDTLRIEAKGFMDFGLPGTCNINQGCGHFNLDNLMLVSSVPEPGTLALLCAGMLGAAVIRLRKRH